MAENGDLARISAQVDYALTMARDARETAEKAARDVAGFQEVHAEHAKILTRLVQTQGEMVVKLAEVSTNVQWIRSELATKVDSAQHKADMAVRKIGDADDSKKRSNDAQLIAIIAMLVAIIGGVLGVTDGWPF